MYPERNLEINPGSEREKPEKVEETIKVMVHCT